MNRKLSLLFIPLMVVCVSAHASPNSSQRSYYFPVQNAPHQGQMDTDGILSPGEIPNPNIDYDKAQRHHEHHGDDRVDNPYNDDAAADSRYEKDRERARQEWEDRHHDDYEDNHRKHDREDW